MLNVPVLLYFYIFMNVHDDLLDTTLIKHICYVMVFLDARY